MRQWSWSLKTFYTCRGFFLRGGLQFFHPFPEQELQLCTPDVVLYLGMEGGWVKCPLISPSPYLWWTNASIGRVGPFYVQWPITETGCACIGIVPMKQYMCIEGNKASEPSNGWGQDQHAPSQCPSICPVLILIYHAYKACLCCTGRPCRTASFAHRKSGSDHTPN